MRRGDAGVCLSGGVRQGVVRVAAGGILLVSAVLKSYQLGVESTLEASLLTSRWFLAGVVEFEILLGLCLVYGVFVRSVWLTTITCFSVFACVSLYKGLFGYESCGCFGRVSVSPWCTLVLDVLVVGVFLRHRPSAAALAASSSSWSCARRVATVTLLWLIVGVPAVMAMSGRWHSVRRAAGRGLGAHGTVAAEPAKWTGRRLPILDYVESGVDLGEGTWLVLFFRGGCSACQEAVAEYERLSGAFSSNGDSPRIAFIELPPYGSDYVSNDCAAGVYGRLSMSQDWEIGAPLGVLLARGDVQCVFEDPRDTRLVRMVWAHNE